MKPDAEKPFLVRLCRAFGYGFSGIAGASRGRMFRIQLVVGILTVCIAAWVGVTRAEWAILALAIVGVLSMEALNTAIESVVDLVSPGSHELAKLSKDAAAGAVLIASIGAAAVGLVIFGPRVWATFF